MNWYLRGSREGRMAATLYVLFLLGYLQRATWAQSLGLAHTCSDPSSYSWMYNTQGQSPCEMAVNLVYVCTQDENGPALLNIPCVCNTVTYSLSNACRTCSGIEQSRLPSFSEYANSFQCSSTVSGSFPEVLPSDTPIPPWAYLDPTSDGNFDLAEAEAVADAPTPSSNGGNHAVSTGTGNTPRPASAGHASSSNTPTKPTSPASGPSNSGSTDSAQSLSVTTGGPSLATLSPGGTQLPNDLTTIVNSATVTSILRESATVTSSETQTSSPSGSSKKTRYTNAVIAGTVSAAVLVLLAAVFIGLFFFRRRRRRHHRIARAASRLRRAKRQASVQIPTASKEDLIVDISSPASPQMKLYNPDDPSTYPPPLSDIARVTANVRLPAYTR
ncbi:hypothetical protein FKP32DRAFT_717151 [Trametes sanguinea]|nr:hypothetical protein FKP32DRAFT_717151 [Trametes sanguinea]